MRSLWARLTTWLTLRLTEGQPLFPLVVLFGLNAVDELDKTAFNVLAPEIRRSFGLGISGILALVAVIELVAILLGLPLAYWADRRSRVRLAAGGATLWGSFSLATGLAPTVGVLAAARAGAGMGRAVVTPTHFSLLADYYPPEIRPKVYGTHRAANSVGQFVGPILAGALALWLGWRAPFVLFVVPTAVFVTLAMRLHEPARGGHERRAAGAGDAVCHTEEEPPGFVEGFRMLWRIRTLRRIWYALPFAAAVIVGLGSLFAIFYEQEFGLNSAQRGLAAAVTEPAQLLGLVLGIPLANRLLKRDPALVLRFVALVGRGGGRLLRRPVGDAVPRRGAGDEHGDRRLGRRAVAGCVLRAVAGAAAPGPVAGLRRLRAVDPARPGAVPVDRPRRRHGRDPHRLLRPVGPAAPGRLPALHRRPFRQRRHPPSPDRRPRLRRGTPGRGLGLRRPHVAQLSSAPWGERSRGGRARRGAGGAGPFTTALAQSLARYRYVIGLASAVLLVLALLPTRNPEGAAAGKPGGGSSGFTMVDPTAPKKPGSRPRRAVPPARTTPETAAAAVPGGGQTPTAPRPSSTTATTRRAAVAAAPSLLPSPACDPATGRLAVPTRFAPPCVASATSNGGTTWMGVTGTTITVAVYLARGSVASQALTTAAGNRDTADEVAATYRSYTSYFERHYQTWGRRVRLVFVTPSGADDDPIRARADAVRVATELGAFASWGGPARTSAYAEELAARRVLCICAVPEPDSWYQARAPYVVSPEPTTGQRISLQAEYVAKRLAGRGARFAGDVMLSAQERTFGLIYEDTPGQVGLRGAEALVRALRRAGVELVDSVGFSGAATAPAAGSAEARKVVSRVRQAGATTVLYVGDGFFPVFMTQEATRQGYSPEWVLLGTGGPGDTSGLGADTTFAGRTYDQTQWAHAFGLSFSAARLAPAQGEAWRLHAWHTGHPPPARSSHAAIYRTPWIFFTGLHLGGPALTPASVRDGLFRLPPAGRGMVTSPSVSFGRHGVWAGDDYAAGDDVTELWWDATATGPDEAGGGGVGMYRYADGGRRYLPGQQPATDTAAFSHPNSVTTYDEPPPSDRPPPYPRPD